MDDLLINFGGALKSLGNNKVGGHIVIFGSPDATDLTGDFFTAATDFDIEDGDTRSIYYNHGLDPTIGNTKIGRATIKRDDVGLYMTGELKIFDREKWNAEQLAEREEWLKAVYESVERGDCGLSSGAVAHLVRREAVKNAYELKSWSLGECSITMTPAEPRTQVMALKSYAAAQEIEAKSQLPPYVGREATGAAMSRVNDGLMSHIYTQMYHVANIGTPDAEPYFTTRAPLPPKSKDEALSNISGACDEHKAMCLKIAGAMMDDPDEAGEAKTWAQAYQTDADNDDPQNRTFTKSSERLATDAAEYTAWLSRRQEARIKSGRKLSKANIDRMKEIHGHLTDASDRMGTMIAEHDKPDTEPADDASAKALRRQTDLRALQLRNFHSRLNRVGAK